MKKLSLLITLLITGLFAFAQAPEAFNYQAVARTSNGTAIVNQNVSFRISILQNSSTGSAVYVETQQAMTSNIGLVNFAIGSGTAILGSMSGINWGAGPYFIQTEMDPNGGSNYVLMGSAELLSVPYALHAKGAGSSYWTESNGNINYGNGNVGIGINNPSTELEVAGTTKTDDIVIGNISSLPSQADGPVKIVSSNQALGSIIVKHTNGNKSSSLDVLNDSDIRLGMMVGGSSLTSSFANWASLRTFGNLTSATIQGLAIGHADVASPIVFVQNNSEVVRINSSGMLGIGTSSPSTELEVAGTTKTDDIVIGNTASLPSLADGPVKIVSNNLGLGSVIVKHSRNDKVAAIDVLNSSDLRFSMGLGGNSRTSPFSANWATLRTSETLSSGSSFQGMAIGHGDASAPIVFLQNNSEVIRINGSGMLGIGTNNPKAGIQVTNEDVYIESINKGVIMKSPNGQCWRMTIDNSGNPVVTSITCP